MQSDGAELYVLRRAGESAMGLHSHQHVRTL